MAELDQRLLLVANTAGAGRRPAITAELAGANDPAVRPVLDEGEVDPRLPLLTAVAHLQRLRAGHQTSLREGADGALEVAAVEDSGYTAAVIGLDGAPEDPQLADAQALPRRAARSCLLSALAGSGSCASVAEIASSARRRSTGSRRRRSRWA